MKNSNKKGFTLVELLVVIAILAILATVAVVGYSSFTEKANISNDSVIAKELTTLIQATDINDPVEDFNDVINVLHSNGFVLANLNTKTEGCFFVWDSENNQILLVDGNNNFDVIFPEGEYAPNSNWYLAVCDAATCEKFLANDIIKNAKVQIVPVVTEIKDLASILGSVGIEEIYIDETLTALDDASATLTLELAATKVSSPILSGVPFVVNNGTLNIIGGEISAAGELIDADGKMQHISIIGNNGTLNVTGTKIVSDKAMPLDYDGANGTVTEVTIEANNCGIGVFGGSQVEIVDTGITVATERALWVSGSGGDETKLVVNSGTFTANTNTIGMYGTGSKNMYATIEINDGTFTSETGKLFKFYNYTGSKLVIKGGTFGEYTFDSLMAMEENAAITILEGMITNVTPKSEGGIADAVVTKTADGFVITR